jgi:hypothetical protein
MDSLAIPASENLHITGLLHCEEGSVDAIR